MHNRVGMGYDIHRLVEGRKLLLGGLDIPYIKGLLGHSDGDALLHAICDAILGAIAEGDIGEHFPDTEQKYQNISSSELLRNVLILMHKKGYSIANLDTIIIAEEPKLTLFKASIKKNLAKLMNLNIDCVGVKAKTNEGLGGVGRGEAIICYATVLLTKPT
ncbi:MAG: 2-C-methyl-D-erythritol 2,4-cyclodiphosphate synthase [Candidatus Omnitrophica bacterium]|nr:2-C-methyl-D-erythritol 2,4-cyclodiphosphate synthase [Candidatus Omnitrophota bacterium]